MLKYALTGLCAAIISSSAIADRTAIGDDGREIILKDNGSWEYTSTDRLATSEDGTRVRLKDNGRWEFIGNAPMQTEQEVRTENLGIELNKIVTEYTKESVGSKNTRYDSQTVFYLDVDVSSYGGDIKPNFNNFDLFTAKTNKGTEFPVIAIDGANVNWAAGSKQQIGVRVEGSPTGSIIWGSTKIILEIDKSVFGSSSNISFIERTNEIKKKKVAKLYGE